MVTEKLQRVMKSAARIKFDHGLTNVRHDILHWLDVPERVIFKMHDRLQVSVWNGTDSLYLSEMCWPVSLVTAFTGPWTTRRSSLQTNDCWQKSTLLHWSVCEEQSSCISDKTKRLPWTLSFKRSQMFSVCHVQRNAHGVH